MKILKKSDFFLENFSRSAREKIAVATRDDMKPTAAELWFLILSYYHRKFHYDLESNVTIQFCLNQKPMIVNFFEDTRYHNFFIYLKTRKAWLTCPRWRSKNRAISCPHRIFIWAELLGKLRQLFCPPRDWMSCQVNMSAKSCLMEMSCHDEILPKDHSQ